MTSEPSIGIMVVGHVLRTSCTAPLGCPDASTIASTSLLHNAVASSPNFNSLTSLNVLVFQPFACISVDMMALTLDVEGPILTIFPFNSSIFLMSESLRTINVKASLWSENTKRSLSNGSSDLKKEVPS